MRYAQIRNMDISNGEGVGVSLFVQGCPFHCYNCFNQETWDFDGGKEWTKKTKNDFLKLIDKPYIKRISILGGEPLAKQNLDTVLNLITTIRKKHQISKKDKSANPYRMGLREDKKSNEIRLSFPEKNIWLYTGFTFEQLMHDALRGDNQLYELIKNVDVLVDGRYVDELRDIALKWRGSSNQRVIDVKKSLRKGQVVLYCE